MVSSILRATGADEAASAPEVLQGDDPAGAGPRNAQALARDRPRNPATPADRAQRQATYQALLAILCRLGAGSLTTDPPALEAASTSAPAMDPRVEAFLRAQPEATSIPFISWLADLEAATPAGASEKAQLAAMCSWLLAFRDLLDREGQEAMHADALAVLAGGSSEQAALMRSQPGSYAVRLAEALTGQPAVMEGYSPEYDILLRAAPAAALTQEGVARGLALAQELATDMRERKRRSYAAVVGRAKLTAEQEEALLSGSAASRILDMLLGLEAHEQRVDLLPDCFTPPSDQEQQAASSSGGGGAGGGEDSDLLWCSPLQLLNEIDVRLKAVSQQGSGGDGAAGGGQRLRLLQGVHGLKGQAYEAALVQLGAVIQGQWLQSLPRGGGGRL